MVVIAIDEGTLASDAAVRATGDAAPSGAAARPGPPEASPLGWLRGLSQADLLAVVERALTLTVRTITRNDDSSGHQGSQVRSLLDAHVVVASGLVERTAESGKHNSAVEHARARLAILTGDADQIVTTFGGDLTTQHQAPAVVTALDEAGLHDLAAVHAYLGLAMPPGHRHVLLVDRAVLDARETDDTGRAVTRCRSARTSSRAP